MKVATLVILVVFTPANGSSPFLSIENTASAQSSAEFPVSKLKKAVADAKTDLGSTQSNLTTQYERRLGSQQSMISGYLFKDVVQGIEHGKTVLISSLAGEELASYRAHVHQFYPKPKLEFVGFNMERPLVSVESANESYVRAQKYIAKVETSTASPVIDLMVNSSPTPAYFEMWVDGESSGRTLTTNNPMKNLSRGYYSYRVTKADHKTSEGKLDLINGDGTELNCPMNKSDDREGPYPCSLR